MTEKQIKVIAKHTGRTKINDMQVSESKDYLRFTDPDLKEIKISADNPTISILLNKSPETLKLGRKYELCWNETDNQPKRVFEKDDVIVLVVQEEDNDNNNSKKAGDCPTCSEKINQVLATCEDWETKRKKQLEDLKKGECFHEKTSPDILRRGHYEQETKQCPKCQKKYLSSKSNGAGDEKTFKHDCSQKDNQQNDEENDDDNSNNKIAEKSTVRKYCQDNNVDKLEYDEEAGKLVIIYKKSSNKSKNELEVDNLNKELQEIKNYLKKNGQKDSKNKRKFLVDSDWEEKQQTQKPNKEIDWTPWIIAGGIGLFIIILIAVIGLVRKSD